MFETLIVCFTVFVGFNEWLRFLERREAGRFEHRTALSQLKTAVLKSEDTVKLEQRVRALETKGLMR